MANPLPHSHLTTDPKGMDRRPTRSGALPNVICPLGRGAPPLPVWTVLVPLGTSPPLTVVRGTASQELRGGPIAFLCQVNGHLDVLRPLFHLRPGTADRDGVSFSDHGRSEAKSTVGFRSYLAATMIDCRWPRRVRQWGTPHSSSLSSICGGDR